MEIRIETPENLTEIRRESIKNLLSEMMEIMPQVLPPFLCSILATQRMTVMAYIEKATPEQLEHISNEAHKWGDIVCQIP